MVGFSYTPAADFYGVDSFEYRALDPVSGGYATGLVTLNIAGVNDVPVALADSFTAEFETELVGNVLANDSDPDSQGLTANTVVQPANGTLTFQSNGDFTYLPNIDFVGLDSFSYIASDNDDDTAEVVVSITVNAFVPPEPDLLIHYTFEDQLAGQATDSSGYKNHGTINGAVYESDAGDGTLNSMRFDGSDDVIDAGVLDVAGTGLTLAAWFKADSYPGSSQDPRIITKATGAAANDHVFMLGTVKSDQAVRLRGRVRVNGVTTTLIASGGDLQAGIWYHGTLTYDGTAMRLYLNGADVGSKALSGAVDQDPAVPVEVGGQAGSKFFDGLIDDVRLMQRSVSFSEVQDIIAGNQLPEVVADSYTVVEDNTLSVDAVSGVLANDNEPDGETMSTLLVTDGALGTVTLGPDGAFTYIPQLNASGTDTFTYQVSDGVGLSDEATVTITITEVNDEPVTAPDTYVGAPDEALIIAAPGVLDNDFDPERGSIQASLGNVTPTNGNLTLNADGSFTYTPDFGFGGVDFFFLHGK